MQELTDKLGYNKKELHTMIRQLNENGEQICIEKQRVYIADNKPWHYALGFAIVFGFFFLVGVTL